MELPQLAPYGGVDPALTCDHVDHVDQASIGLLLLALGGTFGAPVALGGASNRP